MLAHGLAVYGGKRVLLIDLDSQCNASLILMGGQGWNEARKAGKTIADYFYDSSTAFPPTPAITSQRTSAMSPWRTANRPRFRSFPVRSSWRTSRASST